MQVHNYIVIHEELVQSIENIARKQINDDNFKSHYVCTYVAVIGQLTRKCDG